MTVPPKPHVIIPRAGAQAIVDYLKRQPYEDVHQLVDILVRAPQANIVEPSNDETSKPA